MQRKIISDEKGFQNIVPMILAVVITFALLFVGVFIIGIVNKNVSSNLSGSGTAVGRMAQMSLNNSTRNFDSVLSVINIAIIITVLAMAIGAIFLFTRQG